VRDEKRGALRAECPVCCLLPAACCLLPAACCLLPAACCLLPAACDIVRACTAICILFSLTLG